MASTYYIAMIFTKAGYFLCLSFSMEDIMNKIL